ncbi:acyltransferase family protein [Acetobacter vaccinii]|uniref:Acyltransferase n=1 Tax=Acetobacter vaccinii TaxID=2592655 RepID=A0A5C1YK11_9PROT|nr:acyltransferase [Acetobacter vaccinii]QEO16373.1 acyltransferase [Acetobacter vaccinii]
MSLPRVQQFWKATFAKSLASPARRRDVDGLRGLAVLLVMFFHAGWIRGGFIGVDIFIVISGYFMGRSAFMQQPFRPERFVWRRLYRLLPALVCMVVLVSAGMLWWVLQSDRADIALNGAYALVYLSNIWASGHVGYFEGQSIAYPFLHTWSLSLEMQFYAIIFLVALLLPSLRRRRSALFAILGGSALCSLMALHVGDRQAYYSIFSRLWEFGLGTLIWFLPRLRCSAKVADGIYGAAVALIVACGVLFDLSAACPSFIVVLPCAATMLIIMLPETRARRVLEQLSPVGVISYSLYLWHWPVIVLAAYLFSIQPQGVIMAPVLGVACLAGLLSYIGVERPMLDYENTASPARCRGGAIALLGVCCLVAAVLAGVSFVSRVH